MREAFALRNIDVHTGVVVLTAAANDLVAAERSDPGVLTDAVNIAKSALVMYQGVYPIEAPYNWWNRSILLPWSSQYWTESEKNIIAKSIDPVELAEILGELATVDLDPGDDILTFYSHCLLETTRSIVQGLAVETMLCADRCIGEVIKGDYVAAAHWISATYKHLIEAMVEIHELFSVSKNAEKAAAARHRETRELKSDVLAYFHEHRKEFKSADAAATAIVVAKIVPVSFRTVRDWILEYLKDQRSVGTP